MRITLYLLLIFSVATQTTAQTIRKVYGYYNTNIPGNIPVVPPEGGKGNPVTYDHTITYHIFIESDKAKAPDIKSVTIKGAIFNTRVQKEPLPAVYEYFDGQKSKKITLVPKGRKYVYRIILTDMDEQLQPAFTNELVIRYSNKGQAKNATLGKMKELPSSALQ